MTIEFNKNSADKFLETFAECWFENKDLVYLAVVRSIKRKPLFNIQIGIKANDYLNTKLLNHTDIPLNCKLNEDELKSFNISEKIGNRINKNQKITVPVDYVEKVTLQHIAKHKIRPMVAGCGIEAHSNSNTHGTLGAFLKISTFDETFLITNFHVLFEFGEIKNELIFQPNNSTNDFSNVIGKYKFGIFGKTKNETYLDVAFIELLNNKHLKNIRTNGFIWSDSDLDKEEPYIKGIELPKCGMDVEIYGMSSGLSKGKIISDNAYVRIEDNSFKNQNKVFKKQILISKISKPGDSGSILINSNTHKAVGLLFAGDNKNISIANDITQIFDAQYLINNQEEKINLKTFLT